MSNQEITRLWTSLRAEVGRIDPRLVENLFPGAGDDAIARLRAALRVPLPEDLEALYRTNNGEGRLGTDFAPEASILSVPNEAQATGFNDYFFMEIEGVDGVIREYSNLPGAEGMEIEGPVKPEPREGAWIPFAKDFGGFFLCLDLDPAEGGTPGQVIEAKFDEGAISVAYPSLAAMLGARLELFRRR